MRKKFVIIIALLFLILPVLIIKRQGKIEPLRLLYLKQHAADFAAKYGNRPVLVVSKKDHLLYYLRDGKIVENDRWMGFTYSFPVRVSLAGRYFKTPEGEMFIEAKNPNSRYILFLKFSYPGAYGIHSAPTRLASFLNRMENLYPDFTFVTKKDDTRGCVAVENRVMKYLFAKIDLKTPVLIMP